MIRVTLPWPPAVLSPNFRTRRQSWVSSVRKQYRAACAEAAWQQGVNPARGLRLERITYHPPAKRDRDDDNMGARFKAGRDGIAAALGVDDKTFNDVPKDFGDVVKGGAVIALLSEIPAT